jgi:hypothetical protein
VRLRRWTVHVGPFVVAAAFVPTVIGALSIAAPAQPSVAGTAGTPAASAAPPTPPPAPVDARTTEPSVAPCTPLRGAPLASAGEATRVTVKAVMSDRGEQTGRRLSLQARRGFEVSVTLPADSFVAQPSGDWVVYGAAGRRHSEIRAIDLDTGCDVHLARIAGVARAAVLDPDGTTLYVHAVDARSRRDLGVSRIDLASGAATDALPAFEPPDGFGPVFATSLSSATDGAALAVQSCGAAACQTRVLDVASGDVSEYRTAHGALVGLTAQALIAFAAGHERPAALLSIDRATGAGDAIAADVYDAELANVDGDPVLRYETAAGWQEVAP